MLIVAGKIFWTSSCAKALDAVAKGKKNALKKLKNKQIEYLTKELTDFVRAKVTRVQRKKLVALITMEIHSRDVIKRMYKEEAGSVTDFAWQMQQRYIFEPPDDKAGGMMINMI